MSEKETVASGLGINAAREKALSQRSVIIALSSNRISEAYSMVAAEEGLSNAERVFMAVHVGAVFRRLRTIGS